jgi:hypothetical protein
MTSANHSGGASVLASRPARLNRLTSAKLLANVRVASPCVARWADMTGDDRARFCAQCQKSVYNLSEMTAEDAADLIRKKEGKLCVRFYQRADGTVLTADCPVGAGALMRRVKRLIAIGVGMLVPALAAPLWFHSPGPKPSTRNKLYQKWDATLLAIRNWVNPPPPTPPPVAPGRFTMGDVYLAPPQMPAPRAPQSGGATPGQ